MNARRRRLARQAWRTFGRQLDRAVKARRVEREKWERALARRATNRLKAARKDRVRLAKAVWREFVKLVKAEGVERRKQAREDAREERAYEAQLRRTQKARERERAREQREEERREAARQKQIAAAARKRLEGIERATRKRRLRVFEPILDDPNQMLLIEDILDVAAKAGTVVGSKEELRRAIVRLSKAQGLQEVHELWQEVAAVALRAADLKRPRTLSRDPEVPDDLAA